LLPRVFFVLHQAIWGAVDRALLSQREELPADNWDVKDLSQPLPPKVTLVLKIGSQQHGFALVTNVKA